jgi:hypothetical protein
MRIIFALVSATLLLGGCGDDTGTATPDAAIDAPVGDAPMADARQQDAPAVTPDAAMGLSDAGIFTTPTTPNMALCGIGGLTCPTPDQKCCADVQNFQFMCVASSGGTCTAPVVIGCDGSEDCPTGQVCCASGSLQSLSGTFQCKTACDTGDQQICHNHTQCDASKPACCTTTVTFGGLSIPLPFGACFAEASVPPQGNCDIP